MCSVKLWNFRTLSKALPFASQPEKAWAEQLGVSLTLLDLLWKRGLDSKESMDAFLSPNLRLLAPPQCWPGLPDAAAVVIDALRANKSLVVWGDYDVDGITSTALVLDVLQRHGIAARPYLPDRRSEGYGLNIPALERLAAEGISVLLTVDCGISDVEAVARARELGMTVVISDHHLPPTTLPPAHAICNPRLGDCPCPQLAGVGVAFFLMAAVNTALASHTGCRCDMREVLDLVALGTLADVVRLSGQNRILVKNGLLKIAEASRPGIAALKVVSGFNAAAALGGGQVVFSLAPRVNAAGRLGEAGLALRLLRAATHEEAAPLAQQLDLMNTQRRTEEERIHKEARILAAAQEQRAGLVLYGKDWHPGVIGIVASRIVDEFYRPTLILCDDNGFLKGSGRSVQEFDLHAGLSAIADVFLGFGGHRLAAGVRLETDKLEELQARFDAAVRTVLGDTPLTPSLTLDGELDFSMASDFTFLKELELLQPFGAGNAEPVFASPPLTVRNRRAFGRAREHVILEVTDQISGITLHAKAWRQAKMLPESVKGRRIRLAYTPRIDTYNGAATVDVRIKDWQLE